MIRMATKNRLFPAAARRFCNEKRVNLFMHYINTYMEGKFARINNSLFKPHFTEVFNYVFTQANLRNLAPFDQTCILNKNL